MPHPCHRLVDRRQWSGWLQCGDVTAKLFCGSAWSVVCFAHHSSSVARMKQYLSDTDYIHEKPFLYLPNAVLVRVRSTPQGPPIRCMRYCKGNDAAEEDGRVTSPCRVSGFGYGTVFHHVHRQRCMLVTAHRCQRLRLLLNMHVRTRVCRLRNPPSLGQEERGPNTSFFGSPTQGSVQSSQKC